MPNVSANERIEGAIYFASLIIHEDQRHIWCLHGRELLQLLQHHQRSSTLEAADHSALHLPSLNVDSFFVAEMSEAASTSAILGGFLHVGMRRSYKRTQEENKRLTSALRLHFPAAEGGDFKLELFVDAMTGNAVAQASGDDTLVRDMLGEYLADGMEGSLWRQEEKRIGTIETTKAFGVLPNEVDYRLLIWLRFSTGMEVFNNLFPNPYPA